MRPINLAPSKSGRRRGSMRVPAMTPYLIVAFLALVLVARVGFALLDKQLADARADKKEVVAELSQTRQEAAALSEYGRFMSLRQKRLAAVNSVVSARFDWARVIADVSKAIPKDAWLVEVAGKVSKNASTGEKSGSTSGGQSGKQELPVPGPTLSLTGCTYRQSQVARMMTQLRNVYQVAQVILSSSEEKDQDDGIQADSKNSTECRTRQNIHKFVITLTFPPNEATQLVDTLKGSGGKKAGPSDSKSGAQSAGSQSDSQSPANEVNTK